ncbi:ArsR/SmtB family transcription factor [Thermodesulfobacteriota bacterium]
MQKVLTITKALSDESRLTILMFLCKRELCICQIIDMLDLSPSTVSKHVAILYDSGLVQRRKEGRWHYYYIPEEETTSDEVRTTIKWLKKNLKNDETVTDNNKRLKSALRRTGEDICRRYKKFCNPSEISV